MTDFDLSAQAATCLYLFLSGAAAGLLYDALMPLRRRSKGLCAASDVLFCAATAALCAVSLALGGANSVRAYALLTLFLGLLFWRLTFRRLWLWFFTKVGRKTAARGEQHTKDNE